MKQMFRPMGVCLVALLLAAPTALATVVFSEDWESTAVDPCNDLFDPWECSGTPGVNEVRAVLTDGNNEYLAIQTSTLDSSTPWVAHAFTCDSGTCEVNFDFYAGDVDAGGYFVAMRLTDASGDIILDVAFDDADANADLTDGSGVTEAGNYTFPSNSYVDLTATIYTSGTNAGKYRLQVGTLDAWYSYNSASDGMPAKIKVGSLSTSDLGHAFWDNIFVSEL
jgi:hypothetical protein